MLEKRPIVRLSFGSDVVILVHLIVRVGCGVGHILWHIIHKVFGSVLDGNVFGIAIHTSHVAMQHLTFIVRKVFERNTSCFGESLCCVVSTERSPVVVGAEIDIFFCVLAERCISINGFHLFVEKRVGTFDVGELRTRNMFSLFWAVVFHCRWDEQAIHLDVLTKSFLIKIAGLRITHTPFAASAESHKCTHIFPRACDDDTCIRNLGIFIGSMVLILLHLWVGRRIVVTSSGGSIRGSVKGHIVFPLTERK